MRDDPDVAYVAADVKVSASVTQTSAPWGLDRIDQSSLPLGGSYTYTPAGSGVKAYIIDTGIRLSHLQFAGRAISGYDAVDGGSADDCHGHGTHVAGTVGASTYGVAKQVTLVAVRVLDCVGGGSSSGVIAGIDWVTGNHAAGQPAVANMSLGGAATTAIDDAVQRSIADGVSYAVAAGNSNTSACNTSPARAANALTVGATTRTDNRSSFSNYGSCLDLFAPGTFISTWSTSNTATNTISGTSMASPHVAGVVALYLQDNPSASPATVAAVVRDRATLGKVINAGTNSPNRLLYSPLTVVDIPAAPGPEPVPASCGLAQRFTGSLSGTGASAIQPNATSYVTATAGVHQGCVRGPAGSDFDLYLDQQLTPTTWTQVARAITSASSEDIAYNGTAGTYRWRVVSYSGGGSYVFEFSRPN